MKLAIGIAIGLLFGLAIGFAGMALFYERAITELRKADKQTSNTEMAASYVCQLNPDAKKSGLLIKGDTSGAKEMIFPWKTDGDRFRIDKTTDLHYIATNIEEKQSKVTESTIDLNRITSDLEITNRFTPAALQIMVAQCQGKLQPQDCALEMKRLGGGGFDCLVSRENSCEGWIGGNTFQMRARYSCRAAERRF
jgi:hypothetical protein